jgi:transcriptional regulator with XRE-family HTH domain
MPVLEQLRRLREERAMSQRDLASAAGVSQATVVRAERGEDTRHVTVRKLAKALKVEPADLMRSPETIGE